MKMGKNALATTLPALVALGVCTSFVAQPQGRVDQPVPQLRHALLPDAAGSPKRAAPAAALLAGGCFWDNGPPLDDLGTPASQMDPGNGLAFFAEVADDFMLIDPNDPGGQNPCSLAEVRFWVDQMFDPAVSWTSLNITIYEDIGNVIPIDDRTCQPVKGPAGYPDPAALPNPQHIPCDIDNLGVVCELIVPVNQIAAFPIPFPCVGQVWEVHVPGLRQLSCVLQTNRKYWIAIAPEMDFELFGQSFMALSEVNTDHPAQQIFQGFGIESWMPIPGNQGDNGIPGCESVPPPGTNGDLAFQVFGQPDEPPPLLEPGCTDCKEAPFAAPQSCGAPYQGGPVSLGDPVYLFSGEFHERAVDLSIRGVGIDFIWGRKYRSRIGPVTTQGNGWDFSYNVRIEQSGPDLVLFDGNTRQDTYALQLDGSWTAPEFFRVITEIDCPEDINGDGVVNVLDLIDVLLCFGLPAVPGCEAEDVNEDGVVNVLDLIQLLLAFGQVCPPPFTLTFPDTGTWNFHGFDGSPQQGKITSIVDRNGNTIDFDYDLTGRLVTIHDTLDTNAHNRDITIAYNPDGLIESVTDFIGRQVQYEYYQDGDADGSAGDLKSATTPIVTGTPNGNDFPDGKTTVYTYSTGFADENLNHNLLTITDPKGQLYLTNIYAPTDDPLDVEFDRVVRQLWGDQDPITGDIIDFVYIPVLPAPENNFGVIRTTINDRVGNVEEFFFDRRNRDVMQRQYTGRWDPDQPTPDPIGPPIPKLRLDDPDFFETRWEYNADALPTRVTHPNLNEDLFVYDEANINRRSQGNLIQHCRLPGPLGGDQIQICEQFEYDDDFGGCCGSNFVTRHVDGRGNETLHEYDAFGNRTHSQHRIPSIVEDFEYNQFGQMTKHILPDNGSACRRVDVFTYYDEADGPQNGYRKEDIIDATDVDSCPGAHFELTTTYEYDPVGNLTRRIDPRGHDDLYEHNQLDQVIRELSREVTDGGGARYEKLTFYDANDNVVRIDVENRDQTGVIQPNTHFTTIYDYEILNYEVGSAEEVGEVNLTNTVVAIGGIPALDLEDFIVTEYEYDENRNQTLMRDGEATNGNQPTNLVRTTYDERDLVFREIRAEGDPDQSSTQSDYDSNRNLKRTSQGLEGTPHVTENTYDGYDRLLTSTDPMGNVTEYHYDPNGNIGGDIDPISQPGVPNPFGVRNSGELIDIAGSAGNVRLSETTYEYDAMDRRTREVVEFFDTATQAPIDDGQAVTEIEYTDTSQVSLVRNDNAHETTTVYDTANRVLTVTDAKANTVNFGYDENSNETTVVEVEKSDLLNPDQEFTTTYAYDNLDRRILKTDNVGNTNAHAYDSRDNRTLRIDALNHETRYTYDGINRLTAVIRDLDDDGADGDGPDITTTQAWDDTSRLVSQTDDNANTTTYSYDALDRIVSETYADGTVHSHTYDVHDNRLTMTDANGSVADCTYDLLDRLTAKTIVPGPGVSNDTTFETYEYDGLSRLVHAQDDDSLVTRSHDSLSRVTSETLNGQTTTCVYDGVGNQTQCTYPGGRIITCTYDDLERKKTISDQAGLVATYDYVGPSRVERREYGNGTRTDDTYDGITGIPNAPDDFGVKQIVGTTHSKIADATIIDERTYTWDRMYNKTQRKDVRAGGPQLTHEYTYDPIYRLVRTVVVDPLLTVLRNEIYELDGVGNRDLVIGGHNPGPYTLDPTLPEPADFQVNQYTTTPNDQRTNDKNGNLISLVDPGAPPPMAMVSYDYRNQMVSYVDPSTTITAQYAYDALGRRIQRVVDDGVLETTHYFYDGWQVVEEQDEFAVTQATYVYGIYIDEVLTMQRGAVDSYYHADDLDSSMAITDTAGTVVERYEYGDYGQPVDPATLAAVSGDPSALGNPYLFFGRRYDPETGWYYYHSRYLDPIAGRFTTRPIIADNTAYFTTQLGNVRRDHAGARRGASRAIPSEVASYAGTLGNLYVFSDNSPFGGYDPTLALPAESAPTGRAQCNPRTGNIDIGNYNKKCDRACTQAHEEDHKAYRGACCKKLSAKIKACGRKSTCVARAINQYRAWQAGTSKFSECRAYKVGLDCRKKLYADKNCCDLPEDASSKDKACCKHLKRKIKRDEKAVKRNCKKAKDAKCPI